MCRPTCHLNQPPRASPWEATLGWETACDKKHDSNGMTTHNPKMIFAHQRGNNDSNKGANPKQKRQHAMEQPWKDFSDSIFFMEAGTNLIIIQRAVS